MANNDDIMKVLPNDAVREALLEIISDKVPSKDYTLHMEDGSAKGDNYIGVVHRLTITYKEGSELKKLGIFLKVPPSNLVRRKQFFARPCFLRESLMYDEFLPLLAEFQLSKGINIENDGFNEYAQCYKNITDEFVEAVFMEDLSLKGFVLHSRFESPSADMAKVVMKALAKLHALSFALKDQWPERFAKFRDLEEIFVGRRDDDLLKNYINGLVQIGLDALSAKGDEENLEKLKSFAEEKVFFDRMMELVDGSRAEPYAVVCHGDAWNNNILFKYEKEKPVGGKLIDWQLSRFASPVCDLMYYIFCCTTKPMRDEHYADILDTYHTELSTFLQRLGSEPEVLFPRSALDAQLKQFGSFGLIMGVMLIPTITTKSEDVPDLDELSAKMDGGDEEYTRKAFEVNVAFSRSRVRDTIVDLINLGYV